MEFMNFWRSSNTWDELKKQNKEQQEIISKQNIRIEELKVEVDLAKKKCATSNWNGYWKNKNAVWAKAFKTTTRDGKRVCQKERRFIY